jgi:tRNA(fMet)-specific endonuclease VapC
MGDFLAWPERFFPGFYEGGEGAARESGQRRDLMYLLDTNTCIFLINKKPKHALDRLHKEIKKKVFLSSISIAELHFGVYNSKNIEANRMALTEFIAPFEILQFDDSDAERFGMIRAELKSQGKMIGPYDLLIAAQALSRNLTLVTNNTDEFSRIKNLKIEDWK